MNIIADITALNLPAHEYLVLGSGILAALNIRQNKDIDLLGAPELFERLKVEGWAYDVVYIDGRDRERLRQETVEVFKDYWYNNGQLELRLDAIQPTVIEGIRFLPLDVLREIKVIMNREKDRTDVMLIDAYWQQNPR